MVSEPGSWWREHGLTVAVLLAAFALAFLVRSIFAWAVFHQWGWLYIYAGGSDSFYHSRVTQYIITTHTNLVRDTLLKYPLGAINPREPLFDWMNAILGILFQGAFPTSSPSLSAQTAGAFFLDLQAPLWAGFGVFPVYLIGKAVSGRRAGLVAAFLFPFIVANIDSSGLGYANYLTFYTFVILVAAYAYLRTVQSVGRTRWVGSYRHPRQIVGGLRAFLRTERTTVKWAVFAGVLLGTLALSWQGYTFLIAILVVFLFVQLLIDRIRHQDSFGLYVSTWIVGLVGFPMAIPYYTAQGLFAAWFYAPLLLFFGVLLILLPFILLRDSPWVLSIPALLGVGLAGALLLFTFDPNTFTNVITGQGYFIKTLVYTTVAEAQAPSIDSLILGYGVITFFLAFAGLILFAIKTGRQKFPRGHLFFLVYCVVSLYLPLTAAKFFLLGSPVYALLPAEVILLIIDAAGYPSLRRNIASLADRRSQATAFRRSFKARHVLVMGLVLLIVVPNIWYSIDAGIPGNVKSSYNLQIYYTLPPPLRTSAANSSSQYLGAAGTSLDTPNQYDEAGYNWLAQQDQATPVQNRPAFISWWDYGFQAVDQGLHPTVADNFQNGIDPAGNFLLSQNESQAIGILITQLLAAEQLRTHQPYLPSGLDAILARDGVDLKVLHSLTVNTSADVPLVIAHPERYLPVDANNLDAQNAMFDATSWFLGNTLSLSGVAQVYNDLEAYTGWSVRYAMVDSRLFPEYGGNTGIFYAPADLTDRVIGGGGAPTAYYTLTVVGSDGNTYPAGSVPPGVQAVNVNIGYSAAFYHSMIYHIFAGYNASDIGQSGGGIPGNPYTNLGSSAPEPAWMLQHFQVVYRTAYFCPYANPSSHPNCFVAANLPYANQRAAHGNATVDASGQSYYSGGESILEYYAGEPFIGTVQLPDGTPVPNVRVTVYDGWNIPHMTATTGKNGTFSLILPPGNDTVNVTAGSFDALTQAGTSRYLTQHLVVPAAAGSNGNFPPLVQNLVLRPATVSGFIYWNTANNSSYIPNTDVTVSGATITLSGGGQVTARATTDASGSYQITNLPPNLYNFTISYAGATFHQNPVYATAGQTSNETIGLSPGTLTGFAVTNLRHIVPGAIVTLTSARGINEGAQADRSGSFTLLNIVPGNYTLRAFVPGTSLSSPSLPVSFLTNGQRIRSNVTLFPTVSYTIFALANGVPVPSFPIRFTPIVPPPVDASNGSSQTQNSSVYLTNSAGILTVSLPLANYSIYGAGLVGSGWYAGFESAVLPAVLPSSGITLPPLAVGPAIPLAGTTPPPADLAGSVPTDTLIQIQDARGDTTFAQDNLSGQWQILLPTGNYSVEAIFPVSSASMHGEAVLTSVSLSGPTKIALALVPGRPWVVRVGTSLPSNGAVWPAQGALVTVAATGMTVPVSAVANATGTATFELPGFLPPGSSYCLGASARGFNSSLTCGLAPSQVFSEPNLPLPLLPIPVNLTFLGFPSGATLRVNFTATAAPAQNRTVVGGASLSVPLYPGGYAVTAWTPAPNGTGVYAPNRPINLTVPFGFFGTNLTVALLHQISAKGLLVLPSGLLVGLVRLEFRSSAFQTNISGGNFTRGFTSVPGSYSVYAFGSSGASLYANLTTVSVSASGQVRPAISLLQSGTTVTGNLSVPKGYTLNGTVPVVLTGPDGSSLGLPAIDGVFRSVLPTGLVYGVSVRSTLAERAANGVTQFVTFTTSPSASCTATGATAFCSLPLQATIGLTQLGGNLAAKGAGPVGAGTLEFVGPSPSRETTQVAVSGGTFSVALEPGAYTVYATAPVGSFAYATILNATVPEGAAAPLSIALLPAWTDTLTLLGGPGTAGTANLTLARSGFPVLHLTGELIGVPLVLALPAGSWALTANSTASPYGVLAPSSGTTVLRLVSGNAATSVPLVAELRTTVSLTVGTPSSATALPGGTVHFSLAVRNTGSRPASFHLIGSPVTWTFAFTPQNFSLPAGNSGIGSAEVAVTLPTSAIVDHAPVLFEALSANGTVLGASSFATTIHVVPRPDLRIGGSPTLSSVGPLSASLTIFAFNGGNTIDSVAFQVSNAAQLAALGWSTTILTSGNPLLGPLTLNAGDNRSLTISLHATGVGALPPGMLSLLATVGNGSSIFTRSLTLAVPNAAVSVTNGTLLVAGPGIGAAPAYPSWLVWPVTLAPAIAFLTAASLWRWWRTRSWVRR